MAAVQLPRVEYEQVPLSGGLDQVTPTLSLPPGVARSATNFEVSITGGYTLIAGYERFDGQSSPSTAPYAVLMVDLTGSLVPGNTMTGATSGASALVLSVEANDVVYTRATSAFEDGETLLVGGSPVGTITSLSASQPPTALAAGVYQGLAADAYRQDIQVVPGNGPIRGVAYINDTLYAWRDNGFESHIYKSSLTGWQAVPLGFELTFASGASAPTEGQTLVGATSGAVAIIKRIVVQSGNWDEGSAAGRLILGDVTGAFVDGEQLLTLGVTRASCSGSQVAITRIAGRRVETIIANFGGNVTTTRIYGCDGVNKAFEFDGEVYVPLNTGMETDEPTHIAFHKNHLFLSFGSSVQFSAIGDPYVWSPIFGAGEIALIDNVNTFLPLPGDQSTGALAIFSDDSTFILYGSDSADFSLVTYNIGVGAKAYSAQTMSANYFFDNRGVMNLQTTLNYGNFDSSAMTLNIRPYVQQRRNLLSGSVVNREKSQYRLFFSDGSGLYLTIANGRYIGAMPIQFPNPVTCITGGERSDGSETAFFGSDSGYVYRLDVGTSFDGQPIVSNLELVFNSAKSPRILKRWRRASVEVTGSSYATFEFSYSLAYRSTEVPQGLNTEYATQITSNFWDAVTWDSFVWDGSSLAPSELELEGTGENISLRFATNSRYFDPFTINSVILHYTPRRGIR